MIGAGLVSVALAGSLLMGPVAMCSEVVSTAPVVLYAGFEAADYTSFDFVSINGEKTTLSVSGGSLVMSSSCARSVTISVKDNNTYKKVLSEKYNDGNFTLDVAGKIKKNKLYYVPVKFTADGIRHEYIDVYISKGSDGNLFFVKSPVYDYNVSRCVELKTDPQSLLECLQPQNDVECDDPFVIQTSDEVCRGCTTDWEKVYAIYTYIVSEFAYDDIQLNDSKYVYQDDTPTLIRRKIAICEGFANIFAALCRVQKIPAVVQFGVTQTFDEFLGDKSKRDNEWPNHAWAAVCLEGKWYYLDPTFDNNNHYVGSEHTKGRIESGQHTYNYYLLPLEVFSMQHKICDADTIHGIESSGSCGASASYKISRDGTLTISGSGEIVLPEGVNGFSRVVFAPGSSITSIGPECFVDCDLLTEVILPDTVKRIEREAFNTCEDLQYVYLPEGLEYIGKEAFDYCDELAYVYVPDSVKKIEQYAFDDCPRLIISVPDSLRGFEDSNYIEPYRIIVR